MNLDIVPGTEEPRGGSGAMFDRIAPRYDLLNRLASFGIDQSWRRTAVRALRLHGGERLLDVATGTADLAILAAHRTPTVTVVGLDPSARMLELGRAKVASAGLEGRITLVQGDATHLPFEAASFDACSMAFGIRNVADRDQALRELRRVLMPGGRLAILELSEPRGPLGALARFHVHHVVPWLGAVLSGAREYRYLERSISAFPLPEAFLERLRAAGFLGVAAHRLRFGAAHLYVAEVPRP